MLYSADEESLTHYQVLGLHPDADYAEIRRKYRAAALALHPDRFSASCLIDGGADSQTLADNEQISVEASPVNFHQRLRELGLEDPAQLLAPGQSNEPVPFLRVQEAWEILRDTEARAEYDKFLSAQRVAHQREEHAKVIGEEVYIPEMDLVEGNEGQTLEYTYPCRCGDYFVVSGDELKELGYTEISSSGGRPESGDIKEQPQENKGDQWQQNSIVLPCQSCSLHIRLHLGFQSA